MLCPNCKTEDLVTSERQNIQIDHCPRCRGVWLDRGELDKLIEMSSPGEDQSDRYNDREFGEDDDAPRKRGYRENNRNDDDDDDDERGESYQSRDREDENRGNERGDTYRSRDRGDDQRGSRGDPEGRSIWREIFENLGDRIPRP